MGLKHETLTHRIIGCAIDVHRELGPGFLESVYESAMEVALTRAGIGYEKQKVVTVFCFGEEVGVHRLDLVVEKLIVVELTAIKALDDIHFATTRSYLKACRLSHGLLLNFATMPLAVKRVIFDPGS